MTTLIAACLRISGRRIISNVAAAAFITLLGNSASAKPAVPGSPGEVLRTILYERSAATPAFLTHPDPQHLVIILLLAAVPLFALYGACMGLPGGIRQSAASAMKTPLLFVCTLAVCVPVLVILAILTGLNLGVLQIVTLVMMCLALNALLLACFAPLSTFFALSSEYHFMKLLHVAIFSICGLISTSILYRSLQVAVLTNGQPRGSGAFLFLLWMVTYGFVGLQMAWTLRPLIGEPGLPFQWLRRRSSGMSVYTAISLSFRKVTVPTNQESEVPVNPTAPE